MTCCVLAFGQTADMRRIQGLVLCLSLTAVARSAQDIDTSVPLTGHVVDAVTAEPRHDVNLFLQDLKWQDVAGLSVAPQPAAAIELRFHETAPGLAAAVTAVGLLPAIHAGPLVFAQLGNDKVRRFLPLREGAYWLYTRTTGEKKVCITGAQLGDRDVFRQPFILSAGLNAQFTLTLSSSLRDHRGPRVVEWSASAGRQNRRAAARDARESGR